MNTWTSKGHVGPTMCRFLYSFRYIVDLYHFERRHISWRARGFLPLFAPRKSVRFLSGFSFALIDLSCPIGAVVFFVRLGGKKLRFSPGKLMVMIVYGEGIRCVYVSSVSLLIKRKTRLFQVLWRNWIFSVKSSIFETYSARRSQK